MERAFCDVLVVGTGAAGLRAAAAASNRGLRVCAVSKGKAGKGSCTGFSGGVMAGTPQGGSLESHFEKTLLAGRGLNDADLVRVLVEEAPARLRELMDWGIKGEYREGYLYARGRPPVLGEEITRCLVAKNMDLGTEFMGEMAVLDMKVSEGCAAVLARAKKDARFIGITSGAVVLATGGAGALYLRHDNPRGILGEGYTLALEAGAVLQDMEFVQFYPLGLSEPGHPPFLVPPRLADRGRLVNGRGEDVLEKYGITERPAAERARDRLSRAMYTEIHRHGEAVWLDLRGLTDKEWRVDPFSASAVKLLGDRYGASRRPVRVAPMAHHFMGGVRISPMGATSVPGLFAAGEVTGGLHGANRMGGNALAEALVFGARAGEAAADWVERNDSKGRKAAMEKLQRTFNTSCGEPGDQGTRILQRNLQGIMWEDGGILRNEEGLARALSALDDLAREMGLSMAAQRKEPGLDCIRRRSVLHVARLVVEAARERRESRGAHFREDFPDQDDQCWRGHLMAHLDPQGGIEWNFEPLSGVGVSADSPDEK